MGTCPSYCTEIEGNSARGELTVKSLRMAALGQEDEQWIAKLSSPEYGQAHLVEGAKEANVHDVRRLLKQISEIDGKYPGGLLAYIRRSRKLLEDAKNSVNPFEGHAPEVPEGEKLEPGTERFAEFETLGAEQLGQCAFVLVAGGLGERLGYEDIKVSLPTEIVTGTTFLQLYADHILSYEAYVYAKTGEKVELPLAIMTSGDTNEKTVAALKKNNYYGLKESQVTVMLQLKVPAIQDNEARIAAEPADRWEIVTKPHGHGDVHTLLNQHGLPEKWNSEGRKWLVFFQDTNGLVFRAIPAVLGVSAKHKFALNTITIPRQCGEPMGALCKLRHTTGTSLTINVEYNQLGPLLLSTGDKKGDCPDETGCSPFPGNTNVLVFALDSYAAALKINGGAVPEFVNPKYKDETKQAFKSPTRLECMMQDFPRLLPPESKVGFTQLDRWFCFGVVKNSVQEGAAKDKAGLPADSAYTGEVGMYESHARLLEIVAKSGKHSLDIEEPKEKTTFLNIPAKLGAKVVMRPSFAVSCEQMKHRIRGSIRMTKNSTLVLDGDVTLKGLDLDGALVLKAAPGASLVVENLVVKNDGWHFKPLADPSKAPPQLAVRGYELEKKGEKVVEVSEGTKTVQGTV